MPDLEVLIIKIHKIMKKEQNSQNAETQALNILGVSGSYKHPKCKSYQCNHPLDPVEYDCEYRTKIDCDDCKYNGRGGRKDPEAKCNQQ